METYCENRQWCTRSQVYAAGTTHSYGRMARIFEFSQWFSLDTNTSALERELELAGMVDFRVAR